MWQENTALRVLRIRRHVLGEVGALTQVGKLSANATEDTIVRRWVCFLAECHFIFWKDALTNYRVTTTLCLLVAKNTTSTTVTSTCSMWSASRQTHTNAV